MSAKSRGTSRELQVVHLYRANGWFAMRAPASLGVADVVALKAGERSHLVEVKSDKKNPYDNFRPDRRAALLDAARLAGAVALLAWWPADGKGLRWIVSEDWPAEPRLVAEAA